MKKKAVYKRKLARAIKSTLRELDSGTLKAMTAFEAAEHIRSISMILHRLD